MVTNHLSAEQIERLEQLLARRADETCEWDVLDTFALVDAAADALPALLAERRQREREVAELRETLEKIQESIFDYCDCGGDIVNRALAASGPEQEKPL